jgi:chromosome segregation ATPase
MAETAETLKQKLSAQIDAAKERLDAMKRELVGIHEEDMQALAEHQTEIRERLDQQKARAEQCKADIAAWKDEKTAHTQEAIASWKQRRELRKLEARAERAEDYAVDMVTTAAYDFDEAEQAVLDALAARLECSAAAVSAQT